MVDDQSSQATRSYIRPQPRRLMIPLAAHACKLVLGRSHRAEAALLS